WGAHGCVVKQQVAQIDTPRRFQGQYHDPEPGLHCNRHRYYNPNTGRFQTPDPIGLAGGLNNYQYVPNPTGWVDPLGLVSQPTNCPESGSKGRNNILDIPQGLSRAEFEELSQVVRAKASELGLGDDVFVQGSRAGGTAKATSDIDLAIRVSPEKFDDFLFNQSKLSNVNPGTAKERTLLHAIETGKIQS